MIERMSVRAALEQYVQAWGRLDVAALHSFWHEDHEATYIAEELDDILLGSDAIISHLSRTASRLNRVAVDLPRFHSRELTADIAVAVFVLRWEMLRVESSIQAVTHTRVSAVLRATPSGWTFVQYMEEPYFMNTSESDWSQFKRDITPVLKGAVPSGANDPAASSRCAL